jgi:hypothetical protein
MSAFSASPQFKGKPRLPKRTGLKVRFAVSGLTIEAENSRSLEMNSSSADTLPQLKPGELVELHRDSAVIELPVNRSQRIHYRWEVATGKVTLPWIEHNDRPTRGDL